MLNIFRFPSGLLHPVLCPRRYWSTWMALKSSFALSFQVVLIQLVTPSEDQKAWEKDGWGIYSSGFFIARSPELSVSFYQRPWLLLSSPLASSSSFFPSNLGIERMTPLLALDYSFIPYGFSELCPCPCKIVPLLNLHQVTQFECVLCFLLTLIWAPQSRSLKILIQPPGFFCVRCFNLLFFFRISPSFYNILILQMRKQAQKN